MHAGWPPVISTPMGLSSLLSLQEGVEVLGLQGRSGAGLVRAITRPGLFTLNPSWQLEMLCRREEFGRLFWISAARGVRRGRTVMGRTGVSRGRSEVDPCPGDSCESPRDGLIPAQPPKGHRLRGYVLVLFLMSPCVSCR